MTASKIKLQTASIFALLLAALTFARGNVSGSDGPGFNVPLGIPAEAWAYFVPKDNPLTTAKIELGRELFFDARLSADGKISCASCHDPKLAFTDGKRVAEGINGRRGPRNSPTILNAMFNSGQFWDGRASTLEAQAVLPLVDPDEMGNRTLDEVVARIKDLPEYRQKFQEVFNGPVTVEAIGKAIAAFERTLVSGNSPFDRFIAGDRNALGEAAQRGFFLFRG
ncbi:MAG TPA: cytochrome-c peroxidase, partial [Blastocatellia bacterium]|nr:cytochrome-c peroxidase [Blastocatellia bacterium]